MERRTFLERLRDKMAERDLSPNGLSEAAGLSRDYLRNLFRTGGSPTIDTAAKIAKELDCRVAWLIGEDDDDSAPGVGAALETVRVIGEVRGGAYHEAFELPRAEQRALRLPRDERYPRVPRFGLRIVGHSVNLVAPDRSIVICSTFKALQERCRRAPRDGDMVIVQRRKADLVEATCKAFVEKNDGYWLEPRSTDTTLKPIHLGSKTAKRIEHDHEEIVVHALVTGVHQEL